MVVCAVDVGLQVNGYVICETKNAEIKLIKEGEIKTSKKHIFSQKLKFIYEELEKEIKEYRPQALALEKLYSHYKHPLTLGILAQVRGVVVVLAEQKGLEIFEYSPTRARKAFLGKGSADSFRVKRMAENITGKSFISNHTADAFSLVVAFSHEEKVRSLMLSATKQNPALARRKLTGAWMKKRDRIIQ
ncbi:MAG: crossover junction endodeoxyribonuclease RuvC [Candidatus Omnitrophica bacterium]|jgi:crossover junction endodeoxyribonuclease RuvC|nr:crossover junction endodeoxyribonuclease RuvC [Candidatus Omnitrophota bacterium]